jgi:hypothetical protein
MDLGEEEDDIVTDKNFLKSVLQRVQSEDEFLQVPHMIGGVPQACPEHVILSLASQYKLTRSLVCCASWFKVGQCKRCSLSMTLSGLLHRTHLLL